MSTSTRLARGCYLALAFVLIAVSSACRGPNITGVNNDPFDVPAAGHTSVTPDNVGMRVGDTVRLVGTYSNAVGTIVPGVRITWDVMADPSAPAAVQVDANGLMTALATGEAVIWADADADIYIPGYATVTVFPAQP